jgi:hypothetical protein
MVGGWLVRTLATRNAGFHRTRFDLPIFLFYLWTVVSSFVSEEPQISLAKIQSASVIFFFYFIQAVVTKRTAVMLVSVMILSGLAGTIYSAYDLFRGRGFIVEWIAPDSPQLPLEVGKGDVIWRIGRKPTYSAADLDQAMKEANPNAELVVSLISQGEHVERKGLRITEDIRERPSPSGIIGSKASHRFRASGWNPHYSTVAEILMVLTLLAFGLALATFRAHGMSLIARWAFGAAIILSFGIAFTAMRTALVATAIGMVVMSARAVQGRARAASVLAVTLVLVVGGLFVYQTRAVNALWLQDPSSSLRLQVARIGLKRILLHPLLGHGMDAIHLHWTEWGFPGREMVHMHSTPVQFAFDRGLPAVGFWLWLMAVFWITASRSERSLRESLETNRYGILLGATGGVAAVFASSLVNYNFGDEEVMIVFWWLMAIVAVLSETNSKQLLDLRASNQLGDV